MVASGGPSMKHDNLHLVEVRPARVEAARRVAALVEPLSLSGRGGGSLLRNGVVAVHRQAGPIAPFPVDPELAEVPQTVFDIGQRRRPAVGPFNAPVFKQGTPADHGYFPGIGLENGWRVSGSTIFWGKHKRFCQRVESASYENDDGTVYVRVLLSEGAHGHLSALKGKEGAVGTVRVRRGQAS